MPICILKLVREWFPKTVFEEYISQGLFNPNGHCMQHFKDGNISLVQQLCSLSDKKRHEEFYGLFVNTTGQFDGHIPADLRMEYIYKSHPLIIMIWHYIHKKNSRHQTIYALPSSSNNSNNLIKAFNFHLNLIFFSSFFFLFFNFRWPSNFHTDNKTILFNQFCYHKNMWESRMRF